MTSGAVSMGDYDFVKVVLERLARERPESAYAWAQVAIKPAKPLAFAAIGGVPVFGLPGNPVSSRVSFELFARPALRKLAGRADVLAEPVLAVARVGRCARRPDGRLHLDRVRVALRGRRATCASAAGRAGEQRALGHGRGQRPRRCCDDGDGVDAGRRGHGAPARPDALSLSRRRRDARHVRGG